MAGGLALRQADDRRSHAAAGQRNDRDRRRHAFGLVFFLLGLVWMFFPLGLVWGLLLSLTGGA